MSKEAIMLINKPIINEDTGEISYTVTLPRVSSYIDVEAENVRIVDYGHAPLET